MLYSVVYLGRLSAGEGVWAWMVGQGAKSDLEHPEGSSAQG